MKTHGWVSLVVWFLAITAEAATCVPAKGRSLVIGYTHRLDWFTTFRVNNSARQLKYKVQFRDLRGKPATQALVGVDALLVPGGADINPEYYDISTLPSPYPETIARYRRYYKGTSEGRTRDPFEHAVYREYFTNANYATLPALGICRGMQMMAVSQGIPMVQDLKAEMGLNNRRHRFDRFHVTDASGLMGDLFPRGTNIGWKNHHQNPRLDYLTAHPDRHPNVRVTATSNQGRVIEAIELTDRPALGVQFHPETSFPHVKNKIFNWLLTSACERSHHGEQQ